MDDAGAGERAPGLKAAAARLAAGVLELFRTRLELASVELAEERERLKALAVLAIAGAVLATLAVALPAPSSCGGAGRLISRFIAAP